jgi:DNA repair photolyase
MHFVKAKGIIGTNNGMNIYRGCQHGCIYCDARSSCYQFTHLFEDIEVKENAIELLEASLKSRRRPTMIGTGAMTDPYMPLEGQLQMTRRTLEIIEKHGFGATVHTKSDRILRDLDLFQRINRQTKAVVQLSLTCMDDGLSRLIEPNVCPTSRRIEVLREFQKAGVPTVVWLCPILPFLTDTEENIRSIIDACRDTGVKGIIWYGPGLTLRDGDREYFYANLDRKFPGLKEEYIRRYGNSYEVNSPNGAFLNHLFHDLCEQYGIWHNNDQIFTYLRTLKEKEEQLRLF